MGVRTLSPYSFVLFLVLLSEEQYQRLRGIAWDRLASAVESMRQQALEKGLTEEVLAELLADER